MSGTNDGPVSKEPPHRVLNRFLGWCIDSTTEMCGRRDRLSVLCTALSNRRNPSCLYGMSFVRTILQAVQ